MKTIRSIEVWTGHRQPPNPMKTIGTTLLALVLLAFIMAFAGCAFEETTTTTTDAKSGLVTVEKKITKKADTAVLGLAGRVVDGYVPRGRVVREEKSGDVRRILKGRPVTKQEIANRWKPLP